MMHQVFLSYSRSEPDRDIAIWIADALAKGGVKMWRDDDELTVRDGTGLNSQIANAIEQAEFVLFVSSSMSLSRPYCQAEIARALERDRKLIIIDIDPGETLLPEPLLPLQARFGSRASARGLSSHEWPRFLVEACAREGLAVNLREVDLMTLDLGARIIRPNYLSLRAGGSETTRTYHRQMAEWREKTRGNGYLHLNLSLLQSFLGETDRAIAEADLALDLLPGTPDAYYARAIAGCANRRFDRRSKPETDDILRRLREGRRIPGAGQHLWFLAALVMETYYGARYLPLPEPVEGVLAEGLKWGWTNPAECLRAWDLEASAAHLDRDKWARFAVAFGLRL